MWHKFGLTRLAAAGAVIVCAPIIATTSFAAEKAAAGGGDNAKQAAKDQSRQSYEAGTKAFAAGKFQPAIDLMTTALRAGGLPGPDMAKALYLRGVAYKKQGKPGLAISDLTSALWLKNGLTAEDRTAATAERAEAYRMAGLGDGDSGSEQVAVPEEKPAAAAKVATPAVPAPIPAPAAASATAVAEGAVTRQSPDSEAAKDAARARLAAATPVDSGGLQAAATATLVSRPPTPAASGEQGAGFGTTAVTPSTTPAPDAAPMLSAVPNESSETAASTTDPASNGIKSVTGFFSNLFGGGSSSSQPPSTVTTASTGPSDAQTSSWVEATTVAERSGSASPAAKATKQAAAQTGKSSGSKGKYKVHVAAMRSRDDAEALAKKLAAQYGTDLHDRTPTVDQAVIGSMGTFYRVRVGNYVSQDEPRGLCDKLRSGGFDCLVVTN